LLNALENEGRSFREVLHREDGKTAMLNAAESAFKFLSGTVTLIDISNLYFK
jgi:hypothetical protein